jgi:hypothetical protein
MHLPTAADLFAHLLLPLIAALIAAAPARAAPDDDDRASAATAWAVIRQEVLPALEGRRATAEARAAAREAFFAGRATLADAFPRLDRATLSSGPILRGRLVLLDEAAVARARERAAPGPGLVPGHETERQRALAVTERCKLAFRQAGIRTPDQQHRDLDLNEGRETP